MFNTLMVIGLFLLSFSILMNIYRLIKGPTGADRVQALDAIGINIIAGVAIFSIITHTTAYFDVILLIGILSFVSTIGFSLFVERGAAIERDR